MFQLSKRIDEASKSHYDGYDWSKWIESAFTPNKAWMVKTWKAFNDKYFGGYLRMPNFEVGKMEKPGVIGYWKAMSIDTLPYERDRKGRIIPSTVGRKQINTDGTIRFNSSLKGDDFFWEGVMLHEMCHEYVTQYYVTDALEHLSEEEMEEFTKVVKKDKTEGHHRYWQEEVKRCNEVGPYVLSRYSDILHEANAKVYDCNLCLYYVEVGKEKFMGTSYKKFRDGIAKAIMVTMFPDKLEVYDCNDPLLCNMRRIHRNSDYMQKDDKGNLIDGMDLLRLTDDCVQLGEFGYAKSNPQLLKLVATDADYPEPDYLFMLFQFESGQWAFAKSTEASLRAWRGKIELDPDDNNNIMKMRIDIQDFQDIEAMSRATVKLKDFKVIKTTGAPRSCVQMPSINVHSEKDNYGRPIEAFTLYAINDELIKKFETDFKGEYLSQYDLKFVTKMGQPYAERTAEQWDVIVWRNEGQQIWNGWTVRHVHASAIQRCIQMTQNAEEGITLQFANEKDLSFFNAYVELPQLRTYTANTKGKDMLDMSEWAYDSTPGSTDKATIKTAIGQSKIMNRIDWKSDIAGNKKRMEDWLKQSRMCVVWHTRHNKNYYLTTLEGHVKYVSKILGECKDDRFKPIGNVIWYALPINEFTKLTALSAYRTINPDYFEKPEYDIPDKLAEMCETMGVDEDEEAQDTVSHFMADRIQKPWSAEHLWKNIPAESFDEGITVTCWGCVQLTDEGFEFIQEKGKQFQVLKA